jgi:hypothetical protein
MKFPVEGPRSPVICPGCGSLQPVADYLAEAALDFERNDRDCRRGGVKTSIGRIEAQTRCKAVEAACLRCGAVLPEEKLSRPGRLRCSACGMTHEVQIVPDWIRRVAGEARICVTSVREHDLAATTELDRSADDGKVELLACPGCKGNLRITAATERDIVCEFCGLAIHLSDDLWNRMHPWVDSSWLIGFEGIKDVVEKDRADRARRLAEERTQDGSSIRKERYAISLATGVIVAFVTWLAANAAVPWRIGLVVGVGVGLVTGVVTFLRHGRRTRQETEEEVARLAQYHGFRRTGRRLTGTVDGRKVCIDPDADYLVEVDLSGSPWYLSTREERPDLPAFEPFTTGQTEFDGFFVTRLARSDIARGLPASGAHSGIATFLRYGSHGIAEVLVTPQRLALNPVMGLGSDVASGKRAFDFHETENLISSAKDLAPKLESTGAAAPAERPGAGLSAPAAPAAAGVFRPLAWNSEDERRELLDFTANVSGDPIEARDRPVFGRFEFALICDRCGQSIPVNGPFEVLACPGCGRRCDPSMLIIVLAHGFARGVNRREGQIIVTMAGMTTFRPKKGEPGRWGPTRVLGKAARFKTSYRREEPSCAKCGAPMGAAASGPVGGSACPKCGATHRLIEPPAWLRQEVPSASACLTVEEDLPPPAEQVQAKPLMCPGCGASVALGLDRPRSGDCPYCHGHLVIPDDVWQWLHPGGSHPWYIRFDPSAPGFA